jgi:hypothetical protein
MVSATAQAAATSWSQGAMRPRVSLGVRAFVNGGHAKNVCFH